MDLLAPLAEAFDHTAGVLAGVTTEDLDRATPCTEWDVKRLVGHVIGVVTAMGFGARGEELPDVRGVPLATDLVAQFRAVAGATLSAWTARGTEGLVNIGAGPMPVMAALSVNLIDTATHSWDIAVATGQDADLPDDLAVTALAVAQGFLTDEIRGFAGIGAAVPAAPDAGPTDQLIAYMGRRP